ncbi:hypothetical protein TRFO_22509 [Tritrichomonas foetus]|uniref:Uncharacterized protein n=1 Tax=Tritrichomonas foetus TaxID=1144522 RepID=A0A1J4KGR3_9EUKA|nr:hypothetical protein TRFO_22509 [Tritrichomonas foetus]|eukprot:OHT08846.1 hypothetical protein TRFO_22509 [Tritrichomonas foetus]
MKPRDDDFGSAARYYATPQEQKILVQGLQQYFSLPERSQNRNKIAKDVSRFLCMFSPHWTHRAVRLWFNNNKHTYLPQFAGNAPNSQANSNNTNNQNNQVTTNHQDIGNSQNTPNNNSANTPILTENANNIRAQQIQTFQASQFPQMQNMQLQIAQQQIQPQIQSQIPQIQQQQIQQQQIQQQQISQQQISQQQIQQQQIQQQQIQQQQISQQQISQQQIHQFQPNHISQIPSTPIPTMQQMKQSVTLDVNQGTVVFPPMTPIQVDKNSNIKNPNLNMTNSLKNANNANHALSNNHNINNVSIISDINSLNNVNNMNSINSMSNINNMSSSTTKFVTNPPMQFNQRSPVFQNSPITNAPIVVGNLYQQQNSPKIQQPISPKMQQSQPPMTQANQAQEPTRIATPDKFSKIYPNSPKFPTSPGSVQIMNPLPPQKSPIQPPKFPASPILINGSKNSSLQNFSNGQPTSSMPNSPKQLGMWNRSKEQTQEQEYIPISAALNEIRRTDESDPKLQKQIENYDNSCLQHLAKYGSILPDRIEPMTKYIRFRFPSHESSSIFPDSSSNLELSMSISFGQMQQQFGGYQDASIGHSLTNFASDRFDQFLPTSIFQSREAYKEEKLSYFEAHALTDEYAAYTSLSIGATQRMLYLMKYRENVSSSNGSHLLHFPIESKTIIDSLALDHNNAWMLSKGKIIKLSLTQNIPQTISKIDDEFGDGVLNLFNGGLIVGFPDLPKKLFYINENDGNVNIINTNYDGFRAISTVQNSSKLLCAVSKSTTIRLLSPHGNEERAFVGHCGQVLGVQPLSENIFVSRGDDETVRIWDIRDRAQVSTITTPRISAISLTGCNDYLVCGFHNKYVCAVDLRKDRGKPILGVYTQDYSAITLKYRREDDSLAMFGVIDKDSNKDSMMFVDTNGQSRQRIFRLYSHFIGIDTENR